MLYYSRKFQVLTASAFVFILILLASFSSYTSPSGVYLHQTGTTSSSGKKALQAPPLFDSSFDKVQALQRTLGKAVDPCSEVELPEGGAVPKNVNGVRVLVTGGAGFIGSNLVDRLLQLGYRVRVFDNLYTGFLRNVPLDHNRLEFFHGDIMDEHQLREAFDGVDFAFHLAAMSKVVPSVKNPAMARYCVEVNALGTWNVLNAAREQGAVKKIVYAASSTYYGNKPAPHHEDMAGDFLTPYAASKFEGEMQMQHFDRLFGVPTISTRFFMVYGPRQPSTGAYAIVTGVFAKQITDGKALTIEGDGNHYRDFIHVGDIVTGLILSQQNAGLHGAVVNLGSGSAYSVRDVANLVSSNQVHVDPRPNDLVGTLADTCRMKRLLSFAAKANFTEEMSYMVRETMAGNVFMQRWLSHMHATAAPHLVAPGSPVFSWPKKQNDLDALLAAVRQLSTRTGGDQNGPKLISIIHFSGKDAPEDPAAEFTIDLLLNTVHSLVRYGAQTSYIVVASDEASLQACSALNLPCFFSRQAPLLAVVADVVAANYDVHIVRPGNVYVSPVSSLIEHAETTGADILAAQPLGDVLIRSNERTQSVFKSWQVPQDGLSGNDLFLPSSWPAVASIKKTTLAVESLCGAPPHNSGPNDVTLEKRSPSSDGRPAICSHTTVSHVVVPCPDQPGDNAESTRARLEDMGLWFLTKCGDAKHCDRQQRVPRAWVARPPVLGMTGKLCDA